MKKAVGLWAYIKFIYSGKLDKIKRVLLIGFDFPTWEMAKKWSYLGMYNFYHELHELAKLHVDLQIIQYGQDSLKTSKLIRDLSKQNYDLILVWQPHLNISGVEIDYLRRPNNKIIFVITESTYYSDEEIKDFPYLAERESKILSTISNDSDFVLTFCKYSYKSLRVKGFNVFYSPGFFPSSKTLKHIEKSDFRTSTFVNNSTYYNETRKNVGTQVTKIYNKLGLERIDLTDDAHFVHLFESQMMLLQSLDAENSYDLAKRNEHCNLIAKTRHSIWVNYLNVMSEAKISVSLPSLFKGYPARILEALIAGVSPVLITTDSKIVRKGNINYVNIDDLELLKSLTYSLSTNRSRNYYYPFYSVKYYVILIYVSVFCPRYVIKFLVGKILNG